MTDNYWSQRALWILRQAPELEHLSSDEWTRLSLAALIWELELGRAARRFHSL